MKPIYLRFPDQQTAEKVMLGLGWMASVSGNGQPRMVINPNLDIVGTLYTREEKPVPLPGYHVNALVEETPKELEPYLVTPTLPYRVFAGWHPDEIAAREAAEKALA